MFPTEGPNEHIFMDPMASRFSYTITDMGLPMITKASDEEGFQRLPIPRLITPKPRVKDKLVVWESVDEELQRTGREIRRTVVVWERLGGQSWLGRD